MKKIILITTLTSYIILIGCTWGNTSYNQIRRTCKDVTSYDHNRNNDMKCTSKNWEVKYTSYEWARVLGSL